MSDNIGGETAEPLIHADDRLLMQIENYKAEPAFFELLHTAKAICFADVRVFDEALEEVRLRRQETEQGRLLRRLGLWGVRAVFETHAEMQLYGETLTNNPVNSSDFLVTPNLFTASPDKNIQDHIEAFGRAVLEDTFKILGSDAPGKVEEFKLAETQDEQHPVLVWLADRINDIRKAPNRQFREEIHAIAARVDEATDEFLRDREQNVATQDSVNEETNSQNQATNTQDPTETDFNFAEDAQVNDDYYFHPTRLSPKLMGVYPDNRLVPTCLGGSLLVASFLEKAGASYLHSGVMHTATDAGRVDLIVNAEWILEYLDTLPAAQAAKPKDVIGQLHDKLFEILEVNRGHHAAVITQLVDGSWTYIDPNYHTLITMPKESEPAKDVTAAYEFLKEIDSHIAGTEAVHFNGYGMQARFYTEMLERIDTVEFSDEWYARYAKLAAYSKDALEPLRMFLLAYLTVDSTGEDETAIDELTNNVVLPHLKISKEKYIEGVMNGILQEYAFPDVAEQDRRTYFRACAENFERHPEFKSGLQVAARFLVLKLMQDFNNAYAVIPTIHATSEVALPHYRIGASVLSDFAVYCGDDLPGSFWTTYWPSHISFNDHIADRKNESEVQRQLGRNMANYLDSLSALRYVNSHGIVIKFLEQEGVLTNGHEQKAAGEVAG